MHPLEVAAFDFCFRARGPMRMTGYMGSAWRGGFGQALRHAACVTGLPDRQLEESCVYPYLFETAPDTEGGILAGCDRVPNPFVLAPSWNESHLGREGGELRWVEWARWSGRQQTLLRMGGLLGSLVLPLAGLEAVLAVSRARPLGPCRRGRDDGARRDADRPGMTDPGAHPRRILLAVTGLTPQVVTETLYALAVKGNPAWVPTEIRIITTRQGVEKAQRTLLSDHPGWFRRLCADYRLPGIAFGAEDIRIIGGPDGLDTGPSVKAGRSLAFGNQTWPHMLVRAMLAEQIYRAMTILAGHPYHRA